MGFLSDVQSGFPLIWIKSYEDQRVLTECTKVLRDAKTTDTEGNDSSYRVFLWDITDGLRPLVYRNNELVYGPQITESDSENALNNLDVLDWMHKVAEDNTILFLVDYHPFLAKEHPDYNMIVSQLKKACSKFKESGKSIVVLSAACTVPMELDKLIRRIEYPLPTRDDLKTVLRELCDAISAPYPRHDEDVITSSLGMTTIEAENIYSLVYQDLGRFEPSIIMKEKVSLVKKSGLLEIVETTETINDIGGLEIMKGWFTARAECFTDRARRFGIRPPKGIILGGTAGCNKSLAIKTIASIWNRPCLRLDFGRVFGGIVGESEANMFKIWEIVKVLSPCILWIDEIDKAMAGSKSTQGSHEVTQHVLQIMLTNMQESTEDVFIAATANEVENLPAPLLRAGRIDAKFWVDIPDAVQREEILKIHLRKRGRDIATYQSDVASLIAACDNYTGAEIESWVNESLVRAFHMKHDDLTTEDLMATVGSIVPVSKLDSEGIARSRQWALSHGMIPASATHTTAVLTAEPVRRSRKIVSSVS